MSGVQDNLAAVGALCVQGLSAGRYRRDQAAHGPGGSVIERECGEDAVACFGAAIALFEWQTLALRLLLASGDTAIGFVVGEIIGEAAKQQWAFHKPLQS